MKLYTFLTESYDTPRLLRNDGYFQYPKENGFKNFKRYKKDMLKDKSLSTNFDKLNVEFDMGFISLKYKDAEFLEFYKFIKKNWNVVRKYILKWSSFYINRIENYYNPQEFKQKNELVYTYDNELYLFDKKYRVGNIKKSKYKDYYRISFSFDYAYSYFLNKSKELEYLSGYVHNMTYTLNNSWKKGKFDVIDVQILF